MPGLKVWSVAAVAAFAVCAANAEATFFKHDKCGKCGKCEAVVMPGIYDLKDDGKKYRDGEGSYGLISEYAKKKSHYQLGSTFSFEEKHADVNLSWGGGDKAVISGKVYNNKSKTYWTLEYVLTGIKETSKGFYATDGYGSLDYLKGWDSNKQLKLTHIDLDGKQNKYGKAMIFETDYDWFCKTIEGAGWLDLDCGTNDFKFEACKEGEIPEPATLALLGAGAGVMFRRRKNRETA